MAGGFWAVFAHIIIIVIVYRNVRVVRFCNDNYRYRYCYGISAFFCVCFRWKSMAAAIASRGLPWEPPRDPTVFHVGFHGILRETMGGHGNFHHGRPRDPTEDRGICHGAPVVSRGSYRRGTYRTVCSRGLPRAPAGVPAATPMAYHTRFHAGPHGIPVSSPWASTRAPTRETAW